MYPNFAKEVYVERTVNKPLVGNPARNGQGEHMTKRGIRRIAVVSAIALLPIISTSLPASAAKGDGNGPDVNEQPVAKLKKGGTFVWAINNLPDNFNTSQIDGNTADTSYIMSATLPGFFSVDKTGALVVDKNYASSVELTSKKPQVVTYTLNPKAVWSDGKPVGLADFVGMWKANNGSNTAYESVSTTGYEDIASVKAGKSKGQIVVTFKNIYADWQGLFGGLLPASLTATPGVQQVMGVGSDGDCRSVQVLVDRRCWIDRHSRAEHQVVGRQASSGKDRLPRDSAGNPARCSRQR